ncbi:hypothetical protein DFP73DRAFT_529054 [Morchella snyderi]|nr:hypothetical protein DFP73DRAFT_529054 [Morchella snyderi]
MHHWACSDGRQCYGISMCYLSMEVLILSLLTYIPTCQKVFDRSRCPKKGHVIQCPIHLGIYSAPGNECATCKVIRQAEDREAKEQTRKVKKDPQHQRPKTTTPIATSMRR